jgi:putative ribosome biogenesis GTPase RsgA
MQVRSWGYEPLVVSCETGRGLDEVQSVLAGRTSVIAGPSGEQELGSWNGVEYVLAEG